jgi:hypothetical protein
MISTPQSVLPALSLRATICFVVVVVLVLGESLIKTCLTSSLDLNFSSLDFKHNSPRFSSYRPAELEAFYIIYNCYIVVL